MRSGAREGTRRQALAVSVAVNAVVALAAVIVQTVLDAQERGRRALARNPHATVTQLAAGINARLGSTLEGVRGLANQPFTLEVGSTPDQAFLDGIQKLTPDSNTGMMLLDSKRVITSASLLQDPKDVGTVLDRPGLQAALRSTEMEVLPVAPGRTTSLPTNAIVMPLRTPDGGVRGALLWESAVTADSSLSQEIAELGGKDRGEYVFVDGRGTVLVSSTGERLGRPFADTSLLALEPGFYRMHGEVVDVADVPSVDWRLVFRQDEDGFEAGLGQRVQRTLLLLVVAGVLGGGLVVVMLLRRLRAEREERRRIAEINETREEFLSIVSHELRTPVAGVLGFLQSALDHWEAMAEDERRQTVQRACANAQRLQALTRDVLDTASIEAGELAYLFDLVDMRAEVESSVAAARDLQPERQISLVLPDEATWVRADPDRLQQVMANLLDNALKNSPVEREITVEVRTRGNEVLMSFTDRGAGLSDSELGQVFQKFVRGRGSTTRGTGLGLYISREIVEAHGGRIWASSPEGAGTTFSFTVPLAATPAQPVS